MDARRTRVCHPENLITGQPYRVVMRTQFGKVHLNNVRFVALMHGTKLLLSFIDVANCAHVVSWSQIVSVKGM